MKKVLSLMLALTMVLALSACGESTPTTPKMDGSSSGEASGEDTSIPISEDMPEVDESVVEEPPEVELDGASAVTMETKEETIKNDDGTVVMTYSYQVPMVEVPNDPEVSAAIQADLDDIINSFVADAQSKAEDAKAFYAEHGSDEDTTYTEDLAFTVTRCDERGLSFRVSASGYTGGAHGWNNVYGRSYDVMTGSRLTFEDMGGDAFVDLCKESVLAQVAAEKETNQDIFDEYADYIDWVVQDGTADAKELFGTDEATVEPEFYLDENGVTFISGEYVFQNYAAGVMYFTVTYEELADVLPEMYMPM